MSETPVRPEPDPESSPEGSPLPGPEAEQDEPQASQPVEDNVQSTPSPPPREALGWRNILSRLWQPRGS